MEQMSADSVRAFNPRASGGLSSGGLREAADKEPTWVDEHMRALAALAETACNIHARLTRMADANSPEPPPKETGGGNVEPSKIAGRLGEVDGQAAIIRGWLAETGRVVSRLERLL